MIKFTGGRWIPEIHLATRSSWAYIDPKEIKKCRELNGEVKTSLTEDIFGVSIDGKEVQINRVGEREKG